MSDLKVMPPCPPCPWCGVEGHTTGESLRVSGVFYYEWACGSTKRGLVPWQSDACRVNEAEVEIMRLKVAFADEREARKRLRNRIRHLIGHIRALQETVTRRNKEIAELEHEREIAEEYARDRADEYDRWEE